MRKFVATAFAVILVLGLTAPAFADRGHGRYRDHRGHGHRTATNIALGLSSFAVFNQLFGGFYYYPRPIWAAPVYVPPPVVYTAPPQYVVVQPPPPPQPSVIYYSHGRYELRQYGYQYQWVWIPNVPSPPAAEVCRPTGRYAKTTQGVLPECE